MFANYVVVLHRLFAEPEPPLQQYSEAMQAAPDLQQSVVAVLLDRYLPLLAATVASWPEQLECRARGEDLVQCMAELLASDSLQAAVEQRIEQPGASVHLEQAIALLAGLPVPATPAAIVRFHAAGLMVAALRCERSSSPAVVEARAAAAWHFVQALPRLTATVASLLAEDGEEPVAQLMACNLLVNLTPLLLEQLSSSSSDEQLSSISSNEQLLAWAEATDAALRLLPSLRQLHERCGRDPDQPAAVHLSQTLLRALCPAAAGHAAWLVAQQLRQPQQRVARLAHQLWALHTRTCRLLHFLAATKALWLLPKPVEGRQMQFAYVLVDLLNVLLFVLERSECAGQLRCGGMHAHSGVMQAPARPAG